MDDTQDGGIHRKRWLQWLSSHAANAESYHKERIAGEEFRYFEFNEIPLFIPSGLHRDMQFHAQMLTEAISTVASMCMLEKLDLDGKSLCEWLEIPNHALYWIRRFYSPGRRFIWGRPDFHIVDGKPQCLELNIAAAAGYQMQCGSIASYFEEHPALEDLFPGGEASSLDPLEGFIAMLGRTVKSGESILMADVREADRYSSSVETPYAGMIQLIKKLCDLRLSGSFIEDLDLRTNGVYHSGQRIDKLFLSYYNPHDFTRFADFLPFWHLHEKGLVECIDSLDEILLSNKILFAFTSEFAESLPISTALKRFVHESVPWTRIVRDAKATFKGQTYDMWDLATKEQNSFVLKKAQSAEGKDVYIGRWLSAKEWRSFLEYAFAHGGWVLQEFFPGASHPVQLWRTTDRKVPSTLDQNIVLQDEGAAVTTVSPYLSQGVSVGYCVRHYHAPEPSEQTRPEDDERKPSREFASVKNYTMKPFGGALIV